MAALSSVPSPNSSTVFTSLQNKIKAIMQEDEEIGNIDKDALFAVGTFTFLLPHSSHLAGKITEMFLRQLVNETTAVTKEGGKTNISPSSLSKTCSLSSPPAHSSGRRS